MSLRRAFMVSAAAFASIALTAGVALIFFTSVLHRTASGIGNTVESIRIVEELEIELLAYRAMTEPLARVRNEGRLDRLIRNAGDHVSSPEEGELLANLERQTDEYTAAVRRAAASDRASISDIQESTQTEFDATFRLTRELINVNVDQGRALTNSAARADQWADWIGIGVLVFVVGGMGALAIWLRAAVYAPAVELARTIERYARGERTIRASDQGLAEFRLIARQFNDMASTIEGQREKQLAFLAGVVHDLRNPLSALKLASSFISPDKPLPTEERVRQSYSRVQRQVDRLERMTSDLLDAARIEAGILELQFDECDARSIAKATIDLFEPTAPAHRFVLHVPSEHIALQCDPARIEQVLNNLVSNAIKYSPRGGEVRLIVEQRDDSVVFSVSDEGVGMSKEDQAHLFEPFRRVGTSKETIPGVGLGLFVVRRIVEAHGGRITVESEFGRGSTFRVMLPAKPHAELPLVGEP
ncbi:MAG: HAMP domain-containing histidine kinase [Polyangiaceae bacterium]|nr:HAMP domain-containing histidine kinase [Polyangiaceae bacterium]